MAVIPKVFEESGKPTPPVPVVHVNYEQAQPDPVHPFVSRPKPKQRFKQKQEKITKSELLKAQYYKIKLQTAKMQLAVLKCNLKIKKEQLKQLQYNN